ncbi:hypothetical protein ES703_49001 [subsurface metagenome]
MEIGQKILDRFVFVRFAEDNNLFPDKILNNFYMIGKDYIKILKIKFPCLGL